MLYRASIRFLVMILVLAGVRLGACGPVKHTNEGPLPVSSSHARDDSARDVPWAPDSRDGYARRRRDRDSYGSGDSDTLTDEGTVRRSRSMDEILEAIDKADRERAYQPGQPMADTRPSR